MTATQLENPDLNPISAAKPPTRGCPPIMSRLPSTWSEDQHLPSQHGYLQSTPRTPVPGALLWSDQETAPSYTNARLPRLDEFGRLAWEALHHLRPLSPKPANKSTAHQIFEPHPSHDSHFAKEDFSTESIDLDFNWSELQIPSTLQGTLHGVVFRSRRAPGSTSTDLYEADRLAHEEAVNSGGLLMYWYGTPDAAGNNLATCIWTDKESAKVASRLPKHREAVQHAIKAYQSFDLSEFRVEKREGECQFRVLKDTRVRGFAHATAHGASCQTPSG
ncbi:MAG: hypothetical protein M1828_005454 [Chrysothrix sp. TS-e1954]|nr:MAG: hypothetical protein M1828_005454 [Chrysothrix sp. TS-e1954]